MNNKKALHEFAEYVASQECNITYSDAGMQKAHTLTCNVCRARVLLDNVNKPKTKILMNPAYTLGIRAES